LARTWDISIGGFSAETTFAPRTGTPIYGSIAVGKKSFRFTGQVVWTKGRDRAKPSSRFGVRFNGVENALLESLKKQLEPGSEAERDASQPDSAPDPECQALLDDLAALS